MELDLEFSVQEEERKEVFSTQKKFVRRKERGEIGIRKGLSKGVKMRKVVGLRITRPSKGEKKRKASREMTNESRPLSGKVMIELSSQIDSKKTACCHFMQPTRNRLVPSMLADEANGKRLVLKVF